MRKISDASRPRPLAVKTLAGLAMAGLAIAATFALHDHLGIRAIKTLLGPLLVERAHAPVLVAFVLFASYVAVTGLCIPLEVPFALITGALFGLVGGVVLASFASVIGATIAFLGARFLLRDSVRKRFAPQLEIVNRGIERDGVFYLVNLRLLPILPFTLCNIVMGLTSMPVGVFFVVSQASMIFATVIFVNAGRQLAVIHRMSDILSPPVIGGLAALAILPWIGKGVTRLLARSRPRAAGAGV